MAAIAVILGLGAVAALVWRMLDHLADCREMARLMAGQPDDPPVFTDDLIADLPDPVRRYFRYAIREGTPLAPVICLDMKGRFLLGPAGQQRSLNMQARQIIAPPDGFIWKMKARAGMMWVSGSDCGRWTRFWLWGMIPVARMGGSDDHARSAFGRMLSEAAFWSPTALLPGPGIRWEAPNDHTARVIMDHNGLHQSVDLRLDPQGCIRAVKLDRWSNANPDQTYRLQSFGGPVSQYQDFGGIRIPTHVEGGNFYGTAEYLPFFFADVTGVRLNR